MTSWFVCKCCGSVIAEIHFVMHYAIHNYNEPVLQGFRDGEHKSFTVAVRLSSGKSQ